MTSHGLYLHWEGKRFYRQLIPTPRLLEPVPCLSVSANSHSDHMIIEGDNLQVLASLKSQYEGLIDVIYIDPPYNLGKDDFRYSNTRVYDPDANDSDAVYITDEDGGRHTKWLNFMAPRLYMLWQLLDNDNGVIFVSINDIELFHLGMLLNEIFGEENHVGTLIWKGSTDNNPTRISTEHEYIICYAKDKKKLPRVWSGKQNPARDYMLHEYEKIRSESSDILEIQKRFRAFVKENKSSLEPLTHYILVDEDGPYTGSRTVHKPISNGYFYDVLHPRTGKPCRTPLRGYRYPQETMQRLIDSNQIIFGPSHDQIVQIKAYLKDYTGSLKSVISAIDSRTGSSDLTALFDDQDIYHNAKPVDLIGLLLDYSTRPESIVLDAFAGSGTTGHAVLNLNSKDNSNRRFILIEEGNGEGNLCRTLTAERMKRAIEKYNYDAGFVFYTIGRKLDRQAIVSLERDSLANLICQSDETGRGKGIIRLSGFKYIIGKNHRSEAICLVWNGNEDSEVTPEHLKRAAIEVDTSCFKRPFRIYGTFCRAAETEKWKFCQIPDEILVRMHIQEDWEENE